MDGKLRLQDLPIALYRKAPVPTTKEIHCRNSVSSIELHELNEQMSDDEASPQ